MDQQLNQDILDKLTKVCICTGVSRATIKRTIREGAHTVDQVKKATGAGSGSCEGNRCTEKIQRFLDEAKES